MIEIPQVADGQEALVDFARSFDGYGAKMPFRGWGNGGSGGFAVGSLHGLAVL